MRLKTTKYLGFILLSTYHHSLYANIVMKKGNYNYQAKAQTKFEGRMNKHRQKSALRHEDDMIRLNELRRRRLEAEQGEVRAGGGGRTGDRKDRSKMDAVYGLIAVLCVGVIVYFSFRLLEGKAAAGSAEM